MTSSWGPITHNLKIEKMCVNTQIVILTEADLALPVDTPGPQS